LTFTEPVECAGVVVVIELPSAATVNEVTVVLPMVTLIASVRLAPYMVIGVSPEVMPAVGKTGYDWSVCWLGS